MNRYAYFMVRLPRDDAPGHEVEGLVERLETGEKRAFRSAGELLAFFAGARVQEPKVGSADESDKPIINPGHDPQHEERTHP